MSGLSRDLWLQPVLRSGGPNVIVGGVPPLNGRSSHLIEAAKRGRLDQIIFFSAPLTTRAPPGRPARRPAERPARRPLTTRAPPPTVLTKKEDIVLMITLELRVKGNARGRNGRSGSKLSKKGLLQLGCGGTAAHLDNKIMGEHRTHLIATE